MSEWDTTGPGWMTLADISDVLAWHYALEMKAKRK